MIKCKACGSSLDDATTICPVCGQALTMQADTSANKKKKPKQSHDADDSVADLSLGAAALDQNNEGTQTKHGAHQQPQGTHGAHQQPQGMHGIHLQPLAEHGSHQQPHGVHQQPLAEHGSHQQPQGTHGAHQQPYGTGGTGQQSLAGQGTYRQARGAHQRPPMEQVTHQQTGRVQPPNRGARTLSRTASVSPKVLAAVIAVVAVIVVVIVVLLVFRPAQSSPSVDMPDTVNAGQTIALQGSNFTPNTQVIISIDKRSSATSASLAMEGNLSGTLLTMQHPTQHIQLGPADTVVTVAGDGTFTATIHIDKHLQGTRHTLYVSAQNGQLLVSKQFSIKAALTLCNAGNAGGSVSLGSVLGGASKPVTSSFTLCTQGSGNVDWSSNWDTQKFPWLHLSQSSGHVKAPQAQQVQISASTGSLKAGNYAATVTFSTLHANGNTGTVQLHVNLQVQPQGCLNADNQTLSFTQGGPSLQTVTLHNNCGESGTVSTSVSTDNGISWLSATGGGPVDSAGQVVVSVSVNTQNLPVGQSTGSVTITLTDPNGGTTTQTVTVTVNVPGSSSTGSSSTGSSNTAPCITVDPTSLAFTGQEDGANPASQDFAVNNCGDAGTVTTTVATDSDVSWLSATGGGQLNAGGQLGITVAVNTADLALGQHTGTVTVTQTDANGATTTEQVTVTLTIIGPCITVDPTSLAFTGQQNGANPASQAFTVNNCGDAGTVTTTATTTSEVPWLTASRGGQLNTGGQLGINVGVDTGDLAAGTYTGTVTVTQTDANGVTATQQVPVTLTVTGPCITVNPTSLAFTGQQDGAQPASQTFTVNNCGDTGTVTTVTTTEIEDHWLTASKGGPLNAGGQLGITVNADTSDLIAGTYTGTVTVTQTDANGVTATQQVPVTLTVTGPCITVNPTSLAFTGQQGGAEPASQTFTVNNCGDAGTVSVATGTEEPWLSAKGGGQLNAGGQLGVTVAVDIGDLPAGQYTGVVAVTLTDANGATVTKQVTVTLTVIGPCITVNPTSLAFTGQEGGDNPASQAFTVTNCGDTGAVTTTVTTTSEGSWLSATGGGQLNAGGQLGITVNVDTSDLAAGTYTGTVTATLTDSVGATATQSVSVTLTIIGPCITVSPTSLAFTANQGGTIPASQTFTVANCGDAGTVRTSVTTTSGGSWLSATGGGQLNAGGQLDITVAINTTDLAVGTYTGTVTVTLIDANGVADTQSVSVTLTILD